MGLLDVLNGMQNAQGGQRTPATGGASGGMSPMTKAMLGALAFKAIKSFMENQAGAASLRRFWRRRRKELPLWRIPRTRLFSTRHTLHVPNTSH